MENKTKDSKYNEQFFVNIAFVILALSLFLTVFLILFKDKFNLYFDFTELASLGDYLGGMITAFLTISTILLVYATYKTQQKELSATREQLEETVKQSKITNDTMIKQQFENTFFNMLNLHNSLVENLSLHNSDCKGKDVFIKIFKDINNEHYNNTYELFILDLLKTFNNQEINLFEEYNQIVDLLCEIDMDSYYFYKHFNSEYEFEGLFKKYLSGNTELIIDGDQVSLLKEFNLKYVDLVKILEKDNLIINEFSELFINRDYYKKITYNEVMNSNYFILTPYFKNINTIIDYVNNSEKITSNDEKEYYLKIFSSQFTPVEITLLNYEAYLNEGDIRTKNFLRSLEKVSGLRFYDGLVDTIL